MNEPDDAWADLIEALQILSTGRANSYSVFHCEHDTLLAMADPDKFTGEQKARLDELGFFVGEEFEGCFTSFRYGSA
jgi:hypothetical protein